MMKLTPSYLFSVNSSIAISTAWRAELARSRSRHKSPRDFGVRWHRQPRPICRADEQTVLIDAEPRAARLRIDARQDPRLAGLNRRHERGPIERFLPIGGDENRRFGNTLIMNSQEAHGIAVVKVSKSRFQVPSHPKRALAGALNLSRELSPAHPHAGGVLIF